MTVQTQRKVLFITYHFPPSTAVGGHRIANFVKRLPDFGWDPYILTVKDQHLESVDPQKLDGIDQSRIYKAGLTPTLIGAYLSLKNKLRSSRPRVDSTITSSESSNDFATHDGVESLPKKLKRYILSFLSLPDPQRSWILPATVAAIGIIRREKIDYILTSCPPYSAHLVGLFVKWATGVQWVADFRDPWMTTGVKAMFSTCAASLAIERRMERAVVSNAGRVIANTEMLRDGLRRTHPSTSMDRFVCITNGFDRTFFSDFLQMKKDDVFTITYTGSLYFGRSPEPVFQAIEALTREGVVGPDRIRIRLVGHCKTVEGRPVTEFIEQYGLSEVVEVLDPVSYHDAIAMVRRSHLALLLAPNQPYQIPAKVFDYMGVATRVLALAGEGATAKLVRDTGIGAAFAPSDISGIKQFISDSLDRHEVPESIRDRENIGRFSLDSITERLACELDALDTGAVAPETN